MDWNSLVWLIIPLALIACCAMMMWMMMGPRQPPRDSTTGTEPRGKGHGQGHS